MSGAGGASDPFGSIHYTATYTTYCYYVLHTHTANTGKINMKIQWYAEWDVLVTNLRLKTVCWQRFGQPVVHPAAFSTLTTGSCSL